MQRDGYLSVLNQLTSLRSGEIEHRLICRDGDSPMLWLEYFDKVVQRRGMLGDDLWLRGFVVRFLEELVFSHGRMIVAIEVVEIALAVVTRQVDLAPVILAETYRTLDRALRRCVQVWLATHMGVEVLRPQRSAFDAYCSSSHSRTIPSVRDMYDILEALTEDSVTWHIIPSDVESFTIFFNDSDMWLIVFLGLTGGVEYHPIRVMRQFGYCQDTFEQDPMSDFYQLYPLSSIVMTAELFRLMRFGIHSTSIAMMKGSSYTAEYETYIWGTWSIHEVPPDPPLFSYVWSSKRVRPSSDV